MKGWLESLLSELHKEKLKPFGFKKNARTLSRERSEYVERFNFQGSSWNISGSDWRFYINVGVEFTDLDPEKYWSHFRHTHWADRLERIVGHLPAQWDYGVSTDREKMKSDLFTAIQEGSSHLASRIADIRSEYLQRKEARGKWREA